MTLWALRFRLSVRFQLRSRHRLADSMADLVAWFPAVAHHLVDWCLLATEKEPAAESSAESAAEPAAESVAESVAESAGHSVRLTRSALFPGSGLSDWLWSSLQRLAKIPAVAVQKPRLPAHSTEKVDSQSQESDRAQRQIPPDPAGSTFH